MAFGDVIRSSPDLNLSGMAIGGTSDIIWLTDLNTNRTYERSTTDFSTIRSAASPSGTPTGIGGDADTIWSIDRSTDLVYELSTTDFSTIRSAAGPSGSPNGIGGDANTIWSTDYGTDRVYELDTTDFSIIRSAASPSTIPVGMGGKADVIWHMDSNVDKLYELSTTDFSVIQSDGSPTSKPCGIGGDTSTIWSVDWAFEKIFEHDSGYLPAPDTVSINPSFGTNDVDTGVTITGSDFVDTPSVSIDVTPCTDVVFISSSSLTAVVPSGITAGVYDITVTNPDSQCDTLSDGFEVFGAEGIPDYMQLGARQMRRRKIEI